MIQGLGFYGLRFQVSGLGFRVWALCHHISIFYSTHYGPCEATNRMQGFTHDLGWRRVARLTV